MRANAMIKNGSHFTYSDFFFFVVSLSHILTDPEASSMQL